MTVAAPSLCRITVVALIFLFSRTGTDVLRVDNAEVKKKREAELNRGLHGYLDEEFSCQVVQVRASKGQITVEGSVGRERGELYLVEVPVYTQVVEARHFPTAEPIRSDAEGRFLLKLDRVTEHSAGDSSRDRLLSRWAVARKAADGYALLSHARYADDVEAKWKLPADTPSGRKGLAGFSIGKPLSDIDDLGISAVTVNLILNSFMQTTVGEGRTPFKYGGRTWFTEDRAVRELDRTLLEAAKRDLIVSMIILISQAGGASPGEYGHTIAHPDATPAGIFVMPNVTSSEGVAAYAAALDFLARRYSRPDEQYGRIHHWILQNEVNSGWVWTNAGEKTALRYMDAYHRSMRIGHLIARQYNPHAQVFISLEHNWTVTHDPQCHRAKELLEWLLEFSRAEGDFEWAIAYHPYPEDLRGPRTWEDETAQFTFDTPKITFRNIEVLDAWVRQPRTMYLGKQRRTLHLTEQGPNSPDYSETSLNEQAAAMAYLWVKLERLDSITMFHYHNWVDNRGEGGLRIGLRRFPDDQDDPLGRKPIWHVFRALDSPDQARATEFAKEIIGIRNWSEVPYRGEIVSSGGRSQ
ncbi:MAG: DUF5722 domain-containing protein [Pirellulaceae bacterium]